MTALDLQTFHLITNQSTNMTTPTGLDEAKEGMAKFFNYTENLPQLPAAALLQEIRDTLQQMNLHLVATNARLDSMDARLVATNTRLDSMDARLSNLETDVAQIPKRVNQLAQHALARTKNATIRDDDFALSPFHDLDGGTPNGFPATLGRMKTLTTARVTRLLEIYGQRTDGTDLNGLRKRLRSYLTGLED